MNKQTFFNILGYFLIINFKRQKVKHLNSLGIKNDVLKLRVNKICANFRDENNILAIPLSCHIKQFHAQKH